VTRLLLRVIVDKVVPENACWVLEDAHKGSNLNLVVLDRGTRLAVGRVGSVQLAQIGKARKSPVALFCDEAVVGVCKVWSVRRTTTTTFRLALAFPSGAEAAAGDIRLEVWIVGSQGLEMAKQN
jgi:hypothetical protein